MPRFANVCRFVAMAIACSITMTACTGISVQPSCPASLRVGESGTVQANEVDPGAIPRYQWEVIPDDAGTLDNPNQPSTTFEAAKAGTVRFRITAADGLYQVISECETEILESGVEVDFQADRENAAVGETVALTCTSTGEVDAATFTITQVDGQLVDLEQENGVATYAPDVTDVRTFQCVGRTSTGAGSDPVLVTVGISNEPVDDNTNDNTADNTNDNASTDNQNDNTTEDNENDNTVRPTRPDGDRDSGGR